jgi:predicted cupin superfamily sugar epimerase
LTFIMTKRHDAAYWLEQLRLTPHVEGGAFREVYRSELVIPRHSLPLLFQGDRNASTHIYFMLLKGQFSAFHRIAADEVWHFYSGDPLLIHEITHSGRLVTHRLGSDPDEATSLVTVIHAGSWFASALADGAEYALVGCTVAPGFDFADFELAERDVLVNQYPEHMALIRRLTR